MFSASLMVLAEHDARRDAVETDLRDQLVAAKARCSQLSDALAESAELASKHTFAMGFMLVKLRELGLTVAEIDDLTLGVLGLETTGQ